MTLHIDEQAVHVPLGTDDTLEATLSVPDGATCAVLLADGGQSSLESRPFRFLAKVLNEAGIATLLLDVLTTDEAATVLIAAEMRSNIGLLAERFGAGTDWLKRLVKEDPLTIGYCASGAASAAALVASVARSQEARAVVSVEGRPDLAGPALEKVQAATLLIAAGNDMPVLEANQTAIARLTCEKELVVVSGATRLLEEQGVLETVGALTQGWFQRHLAPAAAGVINSRADALASATRTANAPGAEHGTHR
jgi:dienelactone hydrolase